MERTWRGQRADTRRWAEGAGMDQGQERGREKGEGDTDGDRHPLLQPLHPTPPHLHGQVQPCTRSVHPCTLPRAASPRAAPEPGFWFFRLGRGWAGAPPGHTELTQPPLAVPRWVGAAVPHADAPARRPACPLTAARGAEHQRLAPVRRRDRPHPLLKHQRCSKFFNLPNRSISNYHVSHS